MLEKSKYTVQEQRREVICSQMVQCQAPKFVGLNATRFVCVGNREENFMFKALKTLLTLQQTLSRLSPKSHLR
jgi:hypothetical protein